MFLKDMVAFLKEFVFLGKNLLNLSWVMFPQEMVMFFRAWLFPGF
jgi:hypothetical protein